MPPEYCNVRATGKTEISALLAARAHAKTKRETVFVDHYPGGKVFPAQWIVWTKWTLLAETDPLYVPLSQDNLFLVYVDRMPRTREHTVEA